VRRWHLYNTAKLNNSGHAPKHEANALHFTVLLLPDADFTFQTADDLR
jgi:hypothetical protein